MSNAKENYIKPSGHPSDFEKTLIPVPGRFKIKLLDEVGDSTGYIQFVESDDANHYAQIKESGDEFQLVESGGVKYWKLTTGVSKGYYMSLSLTPNLWVASTSWLFAQPFYYEDERFRHFHTGFPLSVKGAPTVGAFVAAWSREGWTPLRVALEPVE